MSHQYLNVLWIRQIIQHIFKNAVLVLTLRNALMLRCDYAVPFFLIQNHFFNRFGFYPIAPFSILVYGKHSLKVLLHIFIICRFICKKRRSDNKPYIMRDFTFLFWRALSSVPGLLHDVVLIRLLVTQFFGAFGCLKVFILIVQLKKHMA